MVSARFTYCLRTNLVDIKKRYLLFNRVGLPAPQTVPVPRPGKRSTFERTLASASR